MRIWAALALGLCLAGCGGGGGEEVADYSRNACLYAAMKAYPSWGNEQPLLDYLDECKDLPQETKTELRKLTADFVAASNARATQGKA